MTSKQNDQITGPFETALVSLVEAIPGFMVCTETTTISNFVANSDAILEKVNSGEVQLLAVGMQRYMLLSEAHVISLVKNIRRPPSLGDIVRSVTPPSTQLTTSSPYLTRGTSQQFTLPKRIIKE